MKERISELALKLCAAYSASTEEGETLKVLEKELSVADCEMRFDAMSNLIVLKRSKRENARKIMLTAKVDTPCFITCFIEDDGDVKLHKIGEPKVKELFGTEGIFSNGIGAKLHPIKKDDPKCDELYADIGFKTYDEAAKRIDLGMTLSPLKHISKIGNKTSCFGYAAALCAAAVATAFENISDADADVYAVFTTQGCLGYRGLEAALAGICPDTVISVGHSDDIKKTSAAVKDKTGVYSPEISERFGLPAAVFDDSGECGLMLRCGAYCGKAVIPSEKVGTHGESANAEDAEEAAKAIVAVVKEF